MSIAYTNRKGVTYYLCQGVTKTGKPRYYFGREPKGEPVDEIPQGFRISESVNGRVSLVKDRAMQILLKEIAVVEAAVQRHPKARNYRVNVKHDRIEVYELVGPSADELISALAQQGLGTPELASRICAEIERYGQFTAALLKGRGNYVCRVKLKELSQQLILPGQGISIGELRERLEQFPSGTRSP
jgi:hypothetical protein